ncbi:hypothetical protein B711_0314 [Chlamydia psittaci CP3]|nr:hypothetical protein B599_0302 [Chlamydia psittaci MN]AFS26719.1 hypothetical protein B711_0314 [Chlamydia psittaci CP3]EPJ25415.1 hypothetical protein CP09DC77_0712 [Chlamydia psittaci 09DC77]EPL01648.1 hypothetical protein CP09DC79_0434 [Chlamydia psittaci 09DC79]
MLSGSCEFWGISLKQSTDNQTFWEYIDYILFVLSSIVY